jgi:flagellar protein FlaG
MSSEIPNVLKLTPLAAVKAVNKQAEDVDSSNKESVDKTADSKQAKPEYTLGVVRKAVDEGNSLLQSINRNLQFTVDDASKELVVKIVDSESGELVRQIPTEEMLMFIRRMKEMEGQQGSVLQDRA